MIEQVKRATVRGLRRLDDRWRLLKDALLAQMGLSDVTEHLVPLEGAVQHALPPVAPSRQFRESLRDNLSVAAQHRLSGLVIEYPRPFREVLVLSVLLGLITASIGTIVLVRRSRTL